jgi:hypothetical protein
MSLRPSSITVCQIIVTLGSRGCTCQRPRSALGVKDAKRRDERRMARDRPARAVPAAGSVFDRPDRTAKAQRASHLGSMFAAIDCQPRWRGRLGEITVPTLLVPADKDPNGRTWWTRNRWEFRSGCADHPFDVRRRWRDGGHTSGTGCLLHRARRDQRAAAYDRSRPTSSCSESAVLSEATDWMDRKRV